MLTEFCDPANEQSVLKKKGNFLSRLETVVKKSSTSWSLLIGWFPVEVSVFLCRYRPIILSGKMLPSGMRRSLIFYKFVLFRKKYFFYLSVGKLAHCAVCQQYCSQYPPLQPQTSTDFLASVSVKELTVANL
jgi:hypothetical protein